MLVHWIMQWIRLYESEHACYISLTVTWSFSTQPRSTILFSIDTAIMTNFVLIEIYKCHWLLKMPHAHFQCAYMPQLIAVLCLVSEPILKEFGLQFLRIHSGWVNIGPSDTVVTTSINHVTKPDLSSAQGVPLGLSKADYWPSSAGRLVECTPGNFAWVLIAPVRGMVLKLCLWGEGNGYK